MLAANKLATARQAQEQVQEQPERGWQRSIDDWFEQADPLNPIGVTRSAADPVNPMGLQFLVLDVKNQAQQQWLPSGTTQFLNRNQRFRLGVRPMVRGADGRWVRGQLRWTTIVYKTFGWNLLYSQHHWFTRFAALARSNTQLQFKQDEDWLFLDNYSSPLLWPMLNEAQHLGIELMGTRNDTEVQVGARAEFELQAAREDDALLLSGTLTLDGQEHELDPDSPAGTIGDHGFYLQPQDSRRIWLAPSAQPIAAQHRRWFMNRTPLRIPAAEQEQFFTRPTRAWPAASRCAAPPPTWCCPNSSRPTWRWTSTTPRPGRNRTRAGRCPGAARRGPGRGQLRHPPTRESPMTRSSPTRRRRICCARC